MAMTSSASYVRAAILFAIATAAALASTVPSIQPIALAVTVIATGLLAWSVAALARTASEQRIGSDHLRRRTVDLEDQVVGAELGDEAIKRLRVEDVLALPPGRERRLPFDECQRDGRKRRGCLLEESLLAFVVLGRREHGFGPAVR